MTQINLIGKIKKKENDIYIVVEREYKDREGNLIYDEFRLEYWSKNRNNSLCSLNENTKLFIKGRLESDEKIPLIIVEEFMILE